MYKKNRQVAPFFIRPASPGGAGESAVTYKNYRKRNAHMFR